MTYELTLLPNRVNYYPQLISHYQTYYSLTATVARVPSFGKEGCLCNLACCIGQSNTYVRIQKSIKAVKQGESRLWSDSG